MRSYRLRLLLMRFVNLVRPRPRLVPLSVDEVLASTEATGIVERFNEFASASGAVGELSWRGLPMLKTPCDLWSIVELIQELKPGVIVETGTHHGGSARFYNDVARAIGTDSRVITIDVNPKWTIDPHSVGIESIVGVSTDEGVVTQVRAFAERAATAGRHVLVLLDSDHSEENVARELELYAPLVTPGSYIVVEDTNVPGARAAADAFVAAHPEFSADRSRERFLMTFFAGGWLRRAATP